MVNQKYIANSKMALFRVTFNISNCYAKEEKNFSIYKFEIICMSGGLL